MLAIAASQAENYTHKLFDWYSSWFDELPLVYLSNGKELLFRNFKDPSMSQYQQLQSMHRPIDIVRITGIKSYFAGLPILQHKGLRDCQYEAITNLEASFRQGQKKALIVLATGAGKTFTACLAAYRMLSYTHAKRILFLVDRIIWGNRQKVSLVNFVLRIMANLSIRFIKLNVYIQDTSRRMRLL